MAPTLLDMWRCKLNLRSSVESQYKLLKETEIMFPNPNNRRVGNNTGTTQFKSMLRGHLRIQDESEGCRIVLNTCFLFWNSHL